MTTVLTPATLDETLRLLAEHPHALLMAGGTDLLVRRRATFAEDAPPLLSLGRVAELRGIAEEDSLLTIGAATPFECIIADPRVNRYASLLVQAARSIGGPAIRNMATLGGNICTASPAGDSLPPLILLDARVELVSRSGTRTLPIAAFIHGPGHTALRQGELLTRILLPKTSLFFRECFVKIGRRKALAISVTSFAGLARLDQGGAIDEICMAWGSVGPTVVRLPALEKALAGEQVHTALIEQVRLAVAQGVSPITDLRASAGYRCRVAANLAAHFVEELRG